MIFMPATRALVAEMLRPCDVRRAYPLMREALPGLTIEAWLKYARRRLACSDRRRGIMVVRRRGVAQLLGAVCYERCLDMQLGAVLRAEHLVAMDLLYPDQVLATLAAGLDDLASRLGCTSICTTTNVKPFEAADTLLACGYHVAGLALVCDVTPAV